VLRRNQDFDENKKEDWIPSSQPLAVRRFGFRSMHRSRDTLRSGARCQNPRSGRGFRPPHTRRIELRAAARSFFCRLFSVVSQIGTHSIFGCVFLIDCECEKGGLFL